MTTTLKFLFSLYVTLVTSRPDYKCDGKAADVLFIVDTSSSIWRYDLTRHVLPFVQNVVNMFDVGPANDQTHVGMVTIGDDVHLQFHLNTFETKKDIIKAISRTSRTGGGNNIHKALAFVTREMFSEKNGAREGVAQVAVILTDGVSDVSEKTRKAAKIAKERGILIFAVGVGSLVDVRDLRAIASNPTDKFLFHLASFKDLDNVKEALVMKVCDSLVGPQ